MGWCIGIRRDEIFFEENIDITGLVRKASCFPDQNISIPGRRRQQPEQAAPVIVVRR